jgi:hypothetical protein
MEKDAQLLLKMPKGLKLALDSCAQDLDLSTSQLVRKLIRDYTDKNYKGDLFAQEKKKK